MKHKEFATLMLATFMACAVAVSGCSRTDSGNGVDNTGAGSAGKEQTDDYQAYDYAYVPAISQQKMETDADDADVMVTRRACFASGTKTYMVVNTWQNGSGQNWLL